VFFDVHSDYLISRGARSAAAQSSSSSMLTARRLASGARRRGLPAGLLRRRALTRQRVARPGQSGQLIRAGPGHEQHRSAIVADTQHAHRMRVRRASRR
jgi:hypothetical protein